MRFWLRCLVVMLLIGQVAFPQVSIASTSVQWIESVDTIDTGSETIIPCTQDKLNTNHSGECISPMEEEDSESLITEPEDIELNDEQELDDIHDGNNFEDNNFSEQIKEEGKDPEEVFEEIDENQLLAVTEKITLYQGESYIFYNLHDTYVRNLTNNGSTANNRTFDYVSYREDGTIRGQSLDYAGNPVVTVGGYAVVTITSTNPVTFSLNPEHFSWQRSDEPAFLKVTLSQGESYSFTNHSIDTETIEHTGVRSANNAFDYAVYDSDGSLLRYDSDTFVNPDVPAGGTFIVTAPNNPIVVGVSYHNFSGQESDEEALRRVTLQTNESYVFHNRTTSSQSLKLSGEGKQFDIAVYDQDGFDYSYKKGGTTLSSVPREGKMVITATSPQPVTLVYHQEIFLGEASDEPALLTITLNKGESYTISNLSTKSITLYNDASTTKKYDYTSYRSDGTLYNQVVNTAANAIIPAEGWITVTTVTDLPVTFFSYNLLLYGNDSSHPALERIELHKGESYIFTNMSSQTQKVTSNASKKEGKTFDYAIYREDGSAHVTQTGGWQQKMNVDSAASIPAGGSMVVTVVSDLPVTFIYNQQLVDAEPSEAPALLKRTVEKGDSFSFYNNSDKNIPLLSDSGMTKKFDYVSYRSDGTISNQGSNTVSEPTVLSGGWVVVSTVTDEAVTFGVFERLFSGDQNNDWSYLDLYIVKGLTGEPPRKLENHARRSPVGKTYVKLYWTLDMIPEDFVEGKDYFIENEQFWFFTDSLTNIFDEMTIDENQVTITIFDPKVLAALDNWYILPAIAEDNQFYANQSKCFENCDYTIFFLAGINSYSDFFNDAIRDVEMHFISKGKTIKVEPLFPYGYLDNLTSSEQKKLFLLQLGEVIEDLYNGPSNRISRAIHDIKNKKVSEKYVLIGHSGGGVVAYIAALKLQVDQLPAEQVIQVGSPRTVISSWDVNLSTIEAANWGGDPVTGFGTWGAMGEPKNYARLYYDPQRWGFDLHVNYFNSKEWIDSSGEKTSNLSITMNQIYQWLGL